MRILLSLSILFACSAFADTRYASMGVDFGGASRSYNGLFFEDAQQWYYISARSAENVCLALGYDIVISTPKLRTAAWGQYEVVDVQADGSRSKPYLANEALSRVECAVAAHRQVHAHQDHGAVFSN